MTASRGIRPNILPVRGQKFHMLTVLGPGAGYTDATHGGRRRDWVCVCICGRETIVRETNLKNGHTRSCGCQIVESPLQRGKSTNLRHGEARGGGRATAEWRTWRGIRERCLNEQSRAFADYGARGIGVCDKWKDSYEAFLADVGRRPGKGYSIDRIDNWKGYEPGNVRWATSRQQQRNRRDNIMAVVSGKAMAAISVAEQFGVNISTMRCRVARGWSPERAATEPAKKRVGAV